MYRRVQYFSYNGGGKTRFRCFTKMHVFVSMVTDLDLVGVSPLPLQPRCARIPFCSSCWTGTSLHSQSTQSKGPSPPNGSPATAAPSLRSHPRLEIRKSCPTDAQPGAQVSPVLAKKNNKKKPHCFHDNMVAQFGLPYCRCVRRFHALYIQSGDRLIPIT